MTMIKSTILKKAGILILGLCTLMSLGGCVDQTQGSKAVSQTVNTEVTTTTDYRIAATSMATVAICEKLNLDLVGVPKSSLTALPERYQDVEVIGTPMSPDMEILKSVKPDWVLSPSSLQSDLQSKYEAAGMDFAFLNLKSVPGMYKSIQELGQLFNREDEAEALVNEFLDFYNSYKDKNADLEKPRVLVLMGLPGSYIVATENSYVGSLVELAGGFNVYAGSDQEFLTANTEDMKSKDPDIILRTAHAMPDQVVKMFAEEFETNDIWKHFRAVKEGRVYDLSYDKFGMSATFNYPEALEELQPLLYPESESSLEEKDTVKETGDSTENENKTENEEQTHGNS
ncbi:heme ABC transporter substrate-binding protein IsdE [uncultured Robinsoniella sp.]|uniref:heme ABC transporter substrate-binding protein IsdE n=1 Tax=uncultured Robinsoniella sp. TaxID=904190 RepID=UPI00374F4E5C